jgi:hypothetical protein
MQQQCQTKASQFETPAHLKLQHGQSRPPKFVIDEEMRGKMPGGDKNRMAK